MKIYCLSKNDLSLFPKARSNKMFEPKKAQPKRILKFKKWCKAVLLRRSVCPFCKEVFNQGIHPRVKTKAKR